MQALKDTLSKFKWIILGVIGLFVLFVIYNIFFLDADRNESTGLVRQESTVDRTSASGREIIRTLNKIKSITIDPDFFELAAFRRLEDFSIEIEERPVGKDNPFVPFNGLVATTSEGLLGDDLVDTQEPLDPTADEAVDGLGDEQIIIEGGQIN